MTRLADDLGLSSVDSLDEAEARWGVRYLSPSEFESLANAAGESAALHQRWLARLRMGYDREKANLVDEIEELYADLPIADQAPDERENAA
ncbi:MAG: hypothetical protein ACYTG0_09225 [Planctomycetota bacterium]